MSQSENATTNPAGSLLLRWSMIALLVCFAATVRVFDWGWNFAPAGALALFAGVYFRDKYEALLVPVLAMFAGDVGLAISNDNPDYLFHDLMPVIYGCYLLSVFLGFGVRLRWSRNLESTDSVENSVHPQPVQKWGLVIGAGFAGALLFFVITNFATWVIADPTRYSKDFAGLLQCFTLALPFWRNTLASDILFGIVFFGGYEMLKSVVTVPINSVLYND